MRRFLSFRDFDWWLLLLLLAMCCVSLVEVRSTTVHTRFASFESRQIFWFSAGFVLMFVFSRVDYHRILDWAPWAYGFGLISLAAIFTPLGHNALGGRRWIKLGPILFQPSELVKLVLVMVVARYFANLGGRNLTWREIFKALLLVGIPMVLVLKQPDMGTTLTYFPILAAGLFLGGINVRQALILTLCGLALVVGVVSSGKMHSYQKGRLTSFINPDADPRGSGYQVRQSLIAVGDGGIWGKGTEKGTQTQGYFLPIPYTDFIFAAFSEEHGFVGALSVLLLYFFILMRLIQNAQTASDLPGSLIIMGIVAVLTFQIAVNVGMVIGFMPVTGIPLPLMSYGGSSVLFTFLALGVAMNVRMRRFVN
ncbi:MAG TPA: rod shape-determining protein RodA [Terracidiphilus sp.]|jgi:rod shape determining protein RodA|nr:rod shape-determining protein RodA [Terracidiphilus sp.]